ncbi:ATP-binding protein [Desulfobacterales bacterium HSG2]|nr:ATP-binding protein [Desulfobacterales bacterium HSG2]
MQKFVGRKKELKVLEKAYTCEPSAFIPIYGRRRVGKSELILRFIKNKTGIYFVGKRAKQALHIREFLRESSVALKMPLLEGFSASDWESALTAVADAWHRNEKLVIVFDEFQWSAESDPELISVLQKLWDRKWKNSGKIFLIVCGSYIGFMEREVLGRKSPLFGRRTGQIFLKPFGYREAGQFHPDYSLVDKARTYFVCGGIPWYLNFFDSQCSVEMNVVENLLNPYAPLFQEPDFLLREELRDVSNYYAILMAIASGFTSQVNISKNTGIDSRSLHYYLKQLRELGYISRQYPLTTSPPGSRHVRYVLDDPLLRFWFRFVYPNTSYVAHAGGEKAMQVRVSPGLDSYFGYCFERLCREALPDIYIREGVNASFRIGEYWNPKTQIDVVGIRDDNWIDLGECKWGKRPSAASLKKELASKAEHYPNPKNCTLAFRIFSRTPFHQKHTRGIRVHSLKDLYRFPEG